MCSPLVSLECSLLQVNSDLTNRKWSNKSVNNKCHLFLFFFFVSLSWRMPVGWRWHADPHHSWSGFGGSRPHCPLGVPHRQEEEPRRLPVHLRTLVTFRFPPGPACTIPPLRLTTVWWDLTLIVLILHPHLHLCSVLCPSLITLTFTLKHCFKKKKGKWRRLWNEEKVTLQYVKQGMILEGLYCIILFMTFARSFEGLWDLRILIFGHV